MNENIDRNPQGQKQRELSDPARNQQKLRNPVAGHDSPQAALEHELAEVEAEDVASVPVQGPSLQVHGGLALNKGGSNKREGG